jgi:hypothetical protein
MALRILFPVARILSKIRASYDIYLDITSLSPILETESIKKAFFEPKDIGVKLRTATEKA